MATKPQFENEGVQRLFDQGIIDSEGQGIPTEYPKMLYRKGSTKGHLLAEKPLRFQIDGDHTELETRVVRGPDEEAEALDAGWFSTVTLTKTKEQEQAEEIQRLRAQVAEQEPRRGPGRPPKQPETQEAE